MVVFSGEGAEVMSREVGIDGGCEGLVNEVFAEYAAI